MKGHERMGTAERDYMKKGTTQPGQPQEPATGLEAAAEQGLAFVRENQSTIIAAILLIVALVAFALWKQSSDAAYEEQAWAALTEAKKKPPAERDEAIKKVVTSYSGSAAAPFAQLYRASQLTSKGTKKDLEEAKELLTPLTTSSNEAIRKAATLQLEGVKKELEDARTWKLVDAAKKPEDKKPDEKKPELPPEAPK